MPSCPTNSDVNELRRVVDHPTRRRSLAWPLRRLASVAVGTLGSPEPMLQTRPLGGCRVIKITAETPAARFSFLVRPAHDDPAAGWFDRA